MLLPAVVAVAALLLYAARAGVVQLECQDAAASVARALVVEGDDAPVQQIAAQAAGERVTLTVTRGDGQVGVTTVCPVAPDTLGVLPGSVTGSAVGIEQE